MKAHPRTILLTAAALALLLASPATVLSQIPPPPPPPGGGGGGGQSGAGGMPTRAEIEKRVKEELEKLPEKTAELGKIKILYREVPADPVELLKNAGALPPNVNPEAAAKQFLPFVRPMIDKYMGEIGKLITDEEFKLKSVKVVPAEYNFGLIMQEMTPVAVQISGKELKKPLTVPLKNASAKEPFANLKIEIKDGTKNDFSIEVGFGRVLGAASKFEHPKP